MSIRVLIVDDQELVRIGFRLFLETQPGLAVVGEAGDGEEAIERVRELQPDVVLMDIRMPTMDGVEATAKLTSGAIEPAPRVLVLTTFDLDEYVFGALRAGAAGFLLKDAPRERLIEAIRVVHSGEALLSPPTPRAGRRQRRRQRRHRCRADRRLYHPPLTASRARERVRRRHQPQDSSAPGRIRHDDRRSAPGARPAQIVRRG